MAWEIQQQLWQVVELPEPVAANLGTAVATLRLTLSESLECYRCKRTRPVSALEPTTEGLAKCTPGADGYDDCMRLWTAL